MAEQLNVSRNVVISAYEELTAQGLLQTRAGAASTVAADAIAKLGARQVVRNTGRGAASADVISLNYRRPAYDPTAEKAWGRLVRSVRARHIAGTPDPAGLRVLREAVADHLASSRGVPPRPDAVIIVNEAQLGLNIVAQTLLSPGDCVTLEEPHYPGARDLFARLGTQIQTAPVDAEGIDVSSLGGAAQRLAYITPSCHLPLGVRLSPNRSAALSQWVRATGAFLIEDDFNCEYQSRGRISPALAASEIGPERVIYLATAPHAISPTLRMGFLVAPEPLREALTEMRWLAERGTSEFHQEVLAKFIAEGHYQRHLLRTSRRYAARQKRAIADLIELFGDDVHIPTNAVAAYVFVAFRRIPGAQSGTFARAALGHGVAISDATSCFSRPPDSACYMLGVVGDDEHTAREGLERLASAYRAFVPQQ